jgi:hypothetical protein
MDFPTPKSPSNSTSPDVPSQDASTDSEKQKEKERKLALLEGRRLRRNASHRERMANDPEYREYQRTRREAYRRKTKDKKAEARKAEAQIEREVPESDKKLPQDHSPLERRVEKKKPGRVYMMCKWYGL